MWRGRQRPSERGRSLCGSSRRCPLQSLDISSIQFHCEDEGPPSPRDGSAASRRPPPPPMEPFCRCSAFSPQREACQESFTSSEDGPSGGGCLTVYSCGVGNSCWGNFCLSSADEQGLRPALPQVRAGALRLEYEPPSPCPPRGRGRERDGSGKREWYIYNKATRTILQPILSYI
ncbi:hypothetical protein OH77DRAFT_448616 [Trametes cingulata]|nr:hypothetical protein OH77DRAFT_448616 [Trametes cingulata]